MKVVLDASVIVDYLRRKDRGNSLYFKAYQEGCDFRISSVTVAEIYTREELDQIIGGVEVAVVGLEMARKVGELRYAYKLSLGDAFVAALAVAEGWPLLTLDKKAFAKIPGLKFF